MLARKTALPAAEPFEAREAVVADRAPLRPASKHDLAAASPVHALQDRLAREVRAPRSRPGIGLVRPLIVTANLACWWGLVSAGLYVVHHWPPR